MAIIRAISAPLVNHAMVPGVIREQSLSPIESSSSVSHLGLSGDLAVIVILRPQAEESLGQTHLGKRFFASAARRLRMTFPWGSAKLKHYPCEVFLLMPFVIRLISGHQQWYERIFREKAV